MIIPIDIPSPSTDRPTLLPELVRIGHREVILIELQGTLHIECNHTNERDGRLVGKLKIDANGVRTRSYTRHYCNIIDIDIDYPITPSPHYHPTDYLLAEQTDTDDRSPPSRRQSGQAPKTARSAHARFRHRS